MLSELPEERGHCSAQAWQVLRAQIAVPGNSNDKR